MARAAPILAVAARNADAIGYGETSVETLVDSPVYAGAHLRTIALAEGAQQGMEAGVGLAGHRLHPGAERVSPK